MAVRPRTAKPFQSGGDRERRVPAPTFAAERAVEECALVRETLEFRIPERYAARFLDDDQGRSLGSVRAVVVEAGSPLYERIGQLYRELRRKDQYFYHGWEIRRRYSAPELEAAEIFSLEITAVFEPSGEECGTEYDETSACPVCGAGRIQRSNLILDLRRTPRRKDIARTIADEWIISQRLAQLLVDARMTGFELRPVRHKARYQDDPVDPQNYQSGRELLQLAEASGAPYPTWEFWVWLNRPEQSELVNRLDQEHIHLQRRHEQRHLRSRPIWHQLVVTSPNVPTVQPTRFGVEPFDLDEKQEFRCPFGHVLGLAVLSEVFIRRDAWDGSDIVATKELVGYRRGVLVPRPTLLMSPRFRKLLESEKVRGCRFEIAHLV